MITDSVLLVGLAVALVLLILVGCKTVIDFPGLLDRNIIHVFKDLKVEEESIKQIKVIKNYTYDQEVTKRETPDKNNERLIKQSASQNIEKKLPDSQKNVITIHKQQNSNSPAIAQSPHLRTTNNPSSISITSSDASTTSLDNCLPGSVYSAAVDNVTKIKVIRGEVNIVIKKQKHKENFSINIDFPGKDASKPPIEIINNPSEIGHDTTEREEMVQCDFYQTKEHINRHC